MKRQHKSFLFLIAFFSLTVAPTRAAVEPATEQKLTAHDGVANDYFGFAVSLDNDTAVIGAYGDDDKSFSSGSAYVFTRAADGTWNRQDKLMPVAEAEYDSFSAGGISLDGNTVVISSPYDDDDDKGEDSGSAYVFVRAADGTWSWQDKLIPADGASGDYFSYGDGGPGVSLDGDTVVISAYGDDVKGENSGSAYVFVRSGITWNRQDKLVPADGADGDYFGSGGVSLDGDTAVIGAPKDDDKGQDSGSAYVFVRAADGTWSQQDKLTPDDGSPGDAFGTGVALDGNTAIIGSYGDDDNGSFSGSAYVFVRAADGTWSQQDKLTPIDGAEYDSFSAGGISLNGNTVVISSSGDDDTEDNSGSAYVFIRNRSTWEQLKLTASGSVAEASFGRSVSLAGNTVLIGAPGDNESTGLAYIYTLGSDSPDNTAFLPAVNLLLF